MMAWLQQSSLRRNRSVRPCLLLCLHIELPLLLKMPVEETERPATPLKRVGPFEVLPLPQQTAVKTPQRLLKCCCRNSWRFGAATPSGRENRSHKTTHHDVQNLDLRDRFCGQRFVVLYCAVDLWVLAVCAGGCNCVGGRAVRRNFSPSSASSRVSGLCQTAHFLCVGGPRWSAHRQTGRKVGHQKLLSGSCRSRPELELDARGIVSKIQPCPISLQSEAKHGRTTGEITTCPVAATQ